MVLVERDVALGSLLAYASQARAGFESDRWRLMIYNRSDKKSHELLPTWDRNADEYFWSPAVNALFVQKTHAGSEKRSMVP